MRRLMRSLVLTRLARALSSRAGPLQSHLSLAHSLWRATLQQGDVAVDATAGVGHDAAILASLVGPGGTLHALDVDAAALEACAERVRDEANAACLRISAQSHAAPPPGLAPRSATVVAFNLGFLPTRARSDAAPPTTDAETTVEALASWALGAVKPGGHVSLAVYPGHDQGAREAVALRAFAERLPSSAWRATCHQPVNHEPTAPLLLSLHRLYREPPFKYAEDDFDSPPRDAKPRHKFVRTDSGRLFLEEET